MKNPFYMIHVAAQESKELHSNSFGTLSEEKRKEMMQEAVAEIKKILLEKYGEMSEHDITEYVKFDRMIGKKYGLKFVDEEDE